MRWLFILLLLPYRSGAQDASVLMAKAAQLEATFKEEQALPVYQRVLQLQPHNIPVLCRCSDLSCRIGNREADRDMKTNYFKAGLRYAQSAYLLDSTNSEVNVAMAFSLARMALFQSGRAGGRGKRDQAICGTSHPL